ncbi:MAG: CGNR zinc finger domain-containing protein [Fidelibacterota bacterium]|nr:MAG: CGNR zinc finger domain-containing protein [Candidatus Neomarinimicrobiota bacterium]
MGAGKVESSAAEPRTFVCLEFANTVSNHRADNPGEKLGSYADLVHWARKLEVLTDQEAEGLLEAASRKPAEAEAVLRKAKALRETIFNIFSSVAHGRAPLRPDLAILNTEFARVMPYQQILQEDGGFLIGWQNQSGDLSRPLWTVVRCTSNLLTSNELGRVSECDSDACTWLFIDRSKNASRKWCDMGTCGNRAKSKRHYARMHQQEAAEG